VSGPCPPVVCRASPVQRLFPLLKEAKLMLLDEPRAVHCLRTAIEVEPRSAGVQLSTALARIRRERALSMQHTLAHRRVSQ